VFIVRIIVDDQKTDYKGFERKPDAEARFQGAVTLANRNEIESVALFSVPGMSVREAVAAVKEGDSRHVELLDHKVCFEKEIERLRERIKL
jgi:hypothetical protein